MRRGGQRLKQTQQHKRHVASGKRRPVRDSCTSSISARLAGIQLNGEVMGNMSCVHTQVEHRDEDRDPEKNGKEKRHNPTAAGFGRGQLMDGSGTHLYVVPRPSTSREKQTSLPRQSGSRLADNQPAVQTAQSRGNMKHKADESFAKNGAKRKKRDEPETAQPPPASHAHAEKRRAPVGLVNMGNTCYFNAVLQNLYQTLLLETTLRDNIKDTSLPVTQQLTKFFQLSSKPLQADKRHSIHAHFEPIGLFKALHRRSQRFMLGRQQDSYELLRHLLDAVKEEHVRYLRQCRQSSSEDDTPHNRQLTVVDSVFGGHYLTVYHCEACKMPYHLFEPFLDMSLPIAFEDEERAAQYKRRVDQSYEAYIWEQDVVEKAQSSEGHTEYVVAVKKVKERLKETKMKPKDNSVLNCLRFYTREERLDEYYCLNCNQGQAEITLQTGTKQTLVFNPPAILTIHLKRFEQTSHGYVKVSRHIEFDERLHLSYYCSRFAQRQQPEEGGKSFNYRLYGVVVHSGGSLEHGHYTACVRLRNVNNPATAFLQKTFLDREKMMSKEQLIKLVAEDLPRQGLTYPTHCQQDAGEWFDISDTSVRPVTLQQVYKKEAYLLFYERLA